MISIWLATPWRFASRLVIGLGLATAGRRQPMRLIALVVTAAVVIAVVQAIHEGKPAVAIVLSTVAICAAVCPVADAWISRSSEYAADRFATQRGAGLRLAEVLTRMQRTDAPKQTWSARALSRHPTIERRLAAIENHQD